MQKDRLSNKQVIALFKEALAAMEVKKYNWFKIRAYQNAISVLENLTSSIMDIWEDGRLDEIPGIGVGISGHLDELFRHGLVSEWEYTKKGLPEGMFALIGLRGIGAKKAYKLADAFELNNRDSALADLKTHAENHDIQQLEGFGEKSEQDILEALEDMKKTKKEKPRMLLAKAEEVINRYINYMKESPDVEKIDVLGSLRRRSATVGDLDLVVATDKPQEVLEHFVAYSEVAEILAKGDRKAMVVLSTDIQVDLNVSKPEAYGAMLQYNTGSKQHNILLRTYALEKGFSLSEYGIKKNDKLTPYKTEEAFYKAIGLPYIEPEIRHGSIELELAKKDELPVLVKREDIKGDLHMHTTFSDGISTLEELVEKAIDLGYDYIGVSDHSPSVQSRGYKEVERLLSEQRKLVDKINAEHKELKVFFGAEVNILVDNKLALPDDLLSMYDYVIGGIHTGFNQDRNTLTGRFIKALENEYVTFIAHPSGRLINERDACDIDWKVFFDALVQSGKYLEINSQPNRLDLADDLVKPAIDKGIKLLINTDSHEAEQMEFIRYGLDVARRGFCEKKHILNTLPYNEFVKLIKKN